MARHHKIISPTGAEVVPFTSDEEAAQDAVEAAWVASKVSRDAQEEISRLEATITQRRQREAGADDAGDNEF